MNNGNVNNNNANAQLRVRPVRRAVPAGERQGEVSLRALHDAWRSARRRKRPSRNQLAFERRWAENLFDLQRRLQLGTWSPAPATCFIAQRPKARQIHAPDFADRVVHHWLVPPLEGIYERVFIHDSYANRRGKGTHAAVTRLTQFVHQEHSGNGQGWYLQLDVHNFFNSISREKLYRLLKERLTRVGVSQTVLRVVHALLRRPVQAQGIIHRSTAEERARVPAHKRLENAAPGCGLPIGNLSSQFFANVYLNELDHFVKHTLKAKRYLRYVDDFVLVHHDRAQLERWKVQIEQFLAKFLGLKLKADVRLRPLSSGIDFLGYVVYPTHTRIRARVLKHAAEALGDWDRQHAAAGGYQATPADVRRLASIVASYEGHMRHANAQRIGAKLRAKYPCVARFSGHLHFHHGLEGRAIYFRASKERNE